MKVVKVGAALLACGLVLAGMGGTQAQGKRAKLQTGAQTGARGMQGRHGGMGRLLEQLNLTPDQKTKIQSIEMDARAQTKALRKNASLTPDAKKTQVQAIHKVSRERIMEVLTPEQKKKLVALAKAEHGKKGGKKGSASPSGATAPPVSPAP